MTLEEFEAITDEAFSYLLSDFGYSARPPERGGRFMSGFVRRYVKSGFAIHFLFGDADSSHLCSITFDDGVAERVLRRHMARTLSTLLLDRHPDYVHKSSRDVTDETSAAEAILEYGKLLREFGEDAINGDFSAFPTLVYLLMYVAGKGSTSGDCGQPLGIFSSLDLVETAIANRQESMANHEHIDGYEIWCVDIDPRWLIRPDDLK